MRWFLAHVIKLIAYTVYLSPFWVRRWLGHFLGLLWFDVFRIRRKVALENLKLAFPNWSERERVRVARQSCFHLGLNLVEYCLLPFITKDSVDRFFEFEGREHFDQALAQGKGMLCLGSHMGNGDFGIAMTSLIGYPLNLISKEFRAGWLNQMWFDLRRKFGTKFISVEKSSFEILRALRQNEGVIFVLDQFMGPPSGVPTTFFGHPTGTAQGLALFADRTRVPVINCYCYRKSNGKGVLVIEPPIPFLDSGDREKNISRMTQVYTDKIEDIVRRHPEQWMWIHRRWKKFG